MTRLIILNLTLLFCSICSFGQKKLLSGNNVWNEAYFFNGYSVFYCSDLHSIWLGDIAEKNNFSYYEVIDDFCSSYGEPEKITGYIREENNKYYFLSTNSTE